MLLSYKTLRLEAQHVSTRIKLRSRHYTFLRTIGAIIDMKEGNIIFQFLLRKGMEHFLRKKIKFPCESIMRATYGLHTKDDNT